MAKEDQTRALIASQYERNDPIGWFEALYSTANGDVSQIPWADQKPNHNLTSWLDRERTAGTNRSAIIVGCGLGDDAEELARRGFVVSAFDVSQSAIDWCSRRFPSSPVKYAQADLFRMPGEWLGKFNFVFEAYTIQALPRSLRPQAIAAVASLVAPGGELLVICRGREADEDDGSLPWPLTHEEIASFEPHGLRRESFENYFDEERDPPVRRFRARFRKG
ncbi:MAG: class I SAM-dependent methyltransferase [Anaerolineae bacterium]|nr:class I SAM-dependent methyltransferase [Phycisphaerae bacterium]